MVNNGKLSRKSKTVTCKLCKNKGHNKRSCKGATTGGSKTTKSANVGAKRKNTTDGASDANVGARRKTQLMVQVLQMLVLGRRRQVLLKMLKQLKHLKLLHLT